MSDVVSGLLARLDELEQLANDCIAEVGADRVGDEYADGSGTADRDDFPSYPWGSGDRELAFMAGPGHPNDVLRLCRAHRDLIELYQRQYELEASGAGQSTGTQGVLVYAVALLEDVIGALARGLGVEETTDGQ